MVFPKLLAVYLSAKINSFADGSDIDNADGDDETRMKSALAILNIVKKFEVELTAVQKSNLFEGLKMPNSAKYSKEHVIELIGNIKKEFAGAGDDREYSNLLQELCKDSLCSGNAQWMYALPLLHFLRTDCQPFETLSPVAPNNEHFRRQWWGMRWLTLKSIKSLDLNRVINHLAGQFDVDPLLHRSIVWLLLHENKLPSFYKENDNLLGSKLKPETLAHGFHLIISTLKDKTAVAGYTVSINLTQWIQILQDRLSADFLQRLPVEDSKKLAGMMGSTVNHLVELFSTIKQKKSSTHEIILPACQLFAQCYHEAAQLSSNRESLASTEEFGQANSLMHKIRTWLSLYLPEKLTKDGKTLAFKEEFQILTDLFEMGELFPGLQWNDQWTRILTERFKKLPQDIILQVFHWDNVQYHPNIGKVCSDIVLRSIDKNDTQSVDRWFSWLWSSPESQMDKNGKLLSKVLSVHWPIDATEEELFKFLLTWPPIEKYLKLQADRYSVLTEVATQHIELARTILRKAYQEIFSGSITIKQFNLITNQDVYHQFVGLYTIFKADFSANEEDLRTCLNIRSKELQSFRMHQKLNTTLVTICRMDEIDIDTDYVRDKMAESNSGTLRLNEVCNPLVLEQTSTSPDYETDIIFFEHSPAVQKMLRPLGCAAESIIFRNLWEQQALSVKNDMGSEISVVDAEEHIWQIVLEQLRSIYDSVSNAEIRLADVDSLFSDFKAKEQIQQELVNMSVLFEEEDNDWIEKRTAQIIEYRQVQFQSDSAIHMLTMQEALELEGDFQALDTLSQMGQPHFKSNPLSSIDESVVKASRALEQVSGKQLWCLEEAAKALKFIEWIRKEIKDMNQLKVFVDLAIIQAGETVLEIDRVWCFHDAAMGYAPIIFELNKDSSCQDLLDACKKVWAALENDHELPLKLRDAKKYVHWLRGVKAQQGGGEVSSISQLEAINSRGTYIIGKIPEKIVIIIDRKMIKSILKNT